MSAEKRMTGTKCMKRTKTYMAKASDQKDRKWVLVDGTDQTLGRLAAKLARVILGKHKPGYTAHLDTGDFVVLVNADKIRVTGNKASQLNYPYYTGFRGGLKTVTYRDAMEKDPAMVITKAVQRMLPKSALGKRMINKLKAYKGTEHPHAAQAPQPIDLTKI
jgi:large subunit ribosomal protein L13